MLSRHHGIPILDAGDGADCMGTAKIRFICFGDSPMQNLSLFDELRHHACNFLRRYVWINAMLVIQIYMVGTKTHETPVDGLPDRFRAGIRGELSVFVLHAEFCGNLHLVPHI